MSEWSKVEAARTGLSGEEAGAEFERAHREIELAVDPLRNADAIMLRIDALAIYAYTRGRSDEREFIAREGSEEGDDRET